MKALTRAGAALAVAADAACSSSSGARPPADLKPSSPAPSAPAVSTAAGVATSAAATSAAPASAFAPSVEATASGVTLTRIASLRGPVAMAFRTGDVSPWIVEQRGTVQHLVDGAATQVLDVSGEIDTDGSERGLLGIAWAPDGRTLYLDGTVKPHGDTRVWAYPVAADGTIDTGHRRTLLEVVQPFANHNGGNLVIGPDKFLYVGLGDGGSAGDPQRNGQNLGTLLGKILRLDPNAAAPYAAAGNPFVGKAGAKPQIWLYGVRNPWRFSFDLANGDLWIGDVGQDHYEEVDLLPASQGKDAGKGANLGWSAREGKHDYNADQKAKAAGAVEPIYEYAHNPGCSITGGYVYRGTAMKSLVGDYVYSDYCTGGVWALNADGSRSTQVLPKPASVSSFGQSPEGELYVMSTSGGVFRLS